MAGWSDENQVVKQKKHEKARSDLCERSCRKVQEFDKFTKRHFFDFVSVCTRAIPICVQNLSANVVEDIMQTLAALTWLSEGVEIDPYDSRILLI